MAHFVITGGLGNIGSALIRELLLRRHDLTIIDNLSTGKHNSLWNLNPGPKHGRGTWRLIEADVRSVDAEVFKDKVVIHLAAIADPQISLNNPDLVTHNCACTAHIVNSKPKHLVFASTAAVYSLNTPYAAAKLVDDELIQERLESYTIFRFGTIFGPSPGMRFHTAVNKFCWQAFTNQPITVWEGAMDAIRPYLYIDDVVETIRDYHDKHGIHDVASCHGTVRDIIASLEKHATIEVKVVPSPPMNQASYKIDCKLPMAYSLDRGIATTLSSFQ